MVVVLAGVSSLAVTVYHGSDVTNRHVQATVRFAQIEVRVLFLMSSAEPGSAGRPGLEPPVRRNRGGPGTACSILILGVESPLNQARQCTGRVHLLAVHVGQLQSDGSSVGAVCS